MVGNLITSFPLFETGQLLTSSQLNDTRTYLDENLRINRTLLNGVGVVSGLEVILGSDGTSGVPKITITKGIGITSDGYLISFPDDVVYTKYAPYFEDAGDALNPSYAPLYNPNTGTLFNLYELTGSGGTLDNLDNLTSKVVVVFLKETIDEHSTFCVSTDSVSSGSVKRYELRVLLMDEADFNQLDSYNNEAFQVRNNPLNHFRMKRFYRAAMDMETPLIGFTDDEAIKTVYTQLVADYKIYVGTAIKNAYDKYYSYLGLNFNESSLSFSQFIDANLNDNNTLAIDNIEHIQYVYSYLKDLIAAYEEFADAAYHSYKDFHPANSTVYKDPDFPRHLALGRVTSQPSMPLGIYKQQYRYYYTQLFYEEGKQEAIIKAQLLFERIVLMIKTFTVPDASGPLTVLITPSVKDDKPLSERAIPYYYTLTSSDYGTRLYAIWNPTAYLQSLSTSTVQAALVQEENSTGTNPLIGVEEHIKNPFRFDINSHNFYRIEGHIGALLVDVLDKLHYYRKLYNIDFNVVSLKLTSDSPLPIPSTDNYNFDLFHHFADAINGMDHKGGVEEGGTFILVHYNDLVVADFSLPSQTVYNAILY